MGMETEIKAEISKREEETKCLKYQLIAAEESHASIISVKEEQIKKERENLMQLEQEHKEEVAKLSSQHQANVEELVTKHQEAIDDHDTDTSQKTHKLDQQHAEEIKTKQEEMNMLESKLKILEETVKK